MNALDMMIIWILCLFSVSLKDSVCSEYCYKTWNRLLLGCHPGHSSFILQAASDTLPTPVNLQQWHIQCDVKCSLCGNTRPTIAHILGGCPVAFSQGRFTYRHDQVLHCIVSNLSGLLAESQTIHVYADLPGMYASVSPQATIPPSLIITPYCPDIVIHNKSTNAVVLLELTCPLDSIQHLESARDQKQTKEDYLQILSELDRLGTPCYYNTIEVSVLGHYLQSLLSSLCNALAIFNKLRQSCDLNVESYLMKLLDYLLPHLEEYF